MTKTISTFLLIATAVFATSIAHAQMGWTKEQVEGKYGRPIEVQGGIFKYDLPKAKFPGLYSNGFNQIIVQYYQGKVIELYLGWEGYKLSSKEVATMDAGNDSDPTVIKMRAYDAKYKGLMQYTTAKQYALSYMDANPDPRAIRNEQHTSANEITAPNLWPGENATLDYKGWHLLWGYSQYFKSPVLYNQSFQITPMENSPLGKEWKAVRAQQMDAIRTREREQQSITIRKETR